MRYFCAAQYEFPSFSESVRVPACTHSEIFGNKSCEVCRRGYLFISGIAFGYRDFSDISFVNGSVVGSCKTVFFREVVSALYLLSSERLRGLNGIVVASVNGNGAVLFFFSYAVGHGYAGDRSAVSFRRKERAVDDFF